MTYKLSQFNSVTIAATQRAWHNDLENSPNYFPSDAHRMIEFARQNSNYADNTLSSLAYGVFSGDSQTADSIVEVIITRESRKIVKMLECAIRPTLTEKAFSNDEAVIDKLIAIYCETILGTILIGDHNNANIIKVYGRTNRLLSILRIVARLLKENEISNTMYNASIEGRWLAVKPVRQGR